jgi:hypothetical protein
MINELEGMLEETFMGYVRVELHHPDTGGQQILRTAFNVRG